MQNVVDLETLARGYVTVDTTLAFLNEDAKKKLGASCAVCVRRNDGYFRVLRHRGQQVLDKEFRKILKHGEVVDGTVLKLALNLA